MQRTYLHLSATKWKRVLAAAFLFVLLAEWGSHTIVPSHPPDVGGASVTANEGAHEDPCQTLILSCGVRREHSQLPSLRHEVTHNAILDPLADLSARIDLQYDPRFPFSGAEPISRPPIPPFHPPEIS